MTVRAIRGATTVDENCQKDIIEATKELLERIVIENGIEKNDIISIFFSLTKDLDAAFPAAAARQLGFTDVALMCMKEIDVPGSLEKCIRVLVHINSEKNNSDIRHVYLRGAKILRPDLV